MRRLYFFIAGVSFVVLLATASAQTDQKTATPQKKIDHKQAHVAQQQEDEGQRIFDANCSRCHNAPEGFSPSISGTIVRHMRVRASLSEHDEKELLRFLNP